MAAADCEALAKQHIAFLSLAQSQVGFGNMT